MSVSQREKASEQMGRRFLVQFIATTTQLHKTYGLKKKSTTDQKVHMRILQYLIFCIFYLMAAKRKTKENKTKPPGRVLYFPRL